MDSLVLQKQLVQAEAEKEALRIHFGKQLELIERRSESLETRLAAILGAQKHGVSVLESQLWHDVRESHERTRHEPNRGIWSEIGHVISRESASSDARNSVLEHDGSRVCDAELQTHGQDHYRLKYLHLELQRAEIESELRQLMSELELFRSESLRLKRKLNDQSIMHVVDLQRSVDELTGAQKPARQLRRDHHRM